MKILIVPNPFKSSLSSIEAANAVKNGIKKAAPRRKICFRLVPISDGGDGLTASFVFAKIAKKVIAEASDPLGRKIKSSYAYIPETNTAIIEMAAASGLVLLKKNELNPLIASTKGTGELLLHAIGKGAKNIILGIGGSATCDCGIGALSALGFKFLDMNSEEVFPLAANLSKIRRIIYPDSIREISSVKIQIACDVANPLLGRNGAAYVYAPQKGADRRQVLLLEKGLANFAKVLKGNGGKDVSKMKGAGAAGGIGASFYVLLGAQMLKGSEIIFNALRLEEKIKNSDLIITGEGRIDSQTTYGKAPAEIAKIAKKYGKPCIAFCGSLGDEIENLHKIGFTAVFSICRRPAELEYCVKNARRLLASAVEEVFRIANCFNR